MCLDLLSVLPKYFFNVVPSREETSLTHRDSRAAGFIRYHLSCPKWDSNLGLSMSHKGNYEAAALIMQPPWLDSLVL